MEALIVAKARAMFFSYGLKSISMDDLARETGMSKKTIYQAVADKAELVQKVVANLLACHKDAVQHYSTASANAIEDVLLQTTYSFKHITAVNQSFFYDLEKSFPETWETVSAHRRWYIGCITQNLRRGIEEGLYRPDLNIDLIAELRMQQLEWLLKSGVLTAYNQPAEAVMTFYLHGIASLKGLSLIQENVTQHVSINEYEQSNNLNHAQP